MLHTRHEQSPRPCLRWASVCAMRPVGDATVDHHYFPLGSSVNATYSHRAPGLCANEACLRNSALIMPKLVAGPQRHVAIRAHACSWSAAAMAVCSICSLSQHGCMMSKCWQGASPGVSDSESVYAMCLPAAGAHCRHNSQHHCTCVVLRAAHLWPCLQYKRWQASAAGASLHAQLLLHSSAARVVLVCFTAGMTCVGMACIRAVWLPGCRCTPAASYSASQSPTTPAH